MGKVRDIKPQIFYSQNKILKDKVKVDLYESALHELFIIENPKFKESKNNFSKEFNDYKKERNIKKIWIYYPYRNKVVCTVDEDAYLKIRTARNRNVITETEQLNYRNSSIGIIGLSIGSIILSSLVATGGPKEIKIADNDIIEISNLNRMWADLLDVGEEKVFVTARNVWQIDPFASINTFNTKIDKDSIQSFLCNKPKLDVFIDAMDSLPLKVLARKICKEKRIPVLMATSNADGVILDIERYDTDEDLQVFHGRLGNITPEDFDFMSYKEWLEKALELVDSSLLTERVKLSISQLGTTISGVPQLSTTVQMGAAAIAYSIRRITNKQTLSSGRYILNLENIIS